MDRQRNSTGQQCTAWHHFLPLTCDPNPAGLLVFFRCSSAASLSPVHVSTYCSTRPTQLDTPAVETFKSVLLILIDFSVKGQWVVEFTTGIYGDFLQHFQSKKIVARLKSILIHLIYSFIIIHFIFLTEERRGKHSAGKVTTVATLRALLWDNRRKTNKRPNTPRHVIKRDI